MTMKGKEGCGEKGDCVRQEEQQYRQEPEPTVAEDDSIRRKVH